MNGPSRRSPPLLTNVKASSSKRLEFSDWDARLAAVNVSKDDLNRILMDYLVVEGYTEAADCFARESGQPAADLQSIEHRMAIRAAVQRGDVENAIERVNDMNPEILDSNPLLYFHLQQQRLIELIRQGRVADALQFAQVELAPRGEQNPAFLAELERTMALLAFDLSKALPSESAASAMPTKRAKEKEKASDEVIWSANTIPANLATLLHPSHRAKTAHELNAAILTSESYSPSPKLPALVRMLSWGETVLKERADFPALDLRALIGGLTASAPTAEANGEATNGTDETMMIA